MHHEYKSTEIGSITAGYIDNDNKPTRTSSVYKHSDGHLYCIVCIPSIYGFLLPVSYLQTFFYISKLW